jgi:hypothetical protein
MATTTPNFGWAVPTSTDLVKDGAVAIETLGDSIDASLVDLKGGTTGQVLAKASNTDMDFSWVAQDDSNAIQNSIVDAKGDIIAATANDTPARLAVGTNGQVLTADSTAATGLAWASASAPAYVSWTPTFTNVTLGNGTVAGSYVKNGKFVSGFVRFSFGSTSAITGNIILPLPSTPENANGDFSVFFADLGTNSYVGTGELSGGNFYVYAASTTGTYLSGVGTSSTVPMTWANGDFLIVSFTYKEV